MKQEDKIIVENVTKSFNVYYDKANTVKERLLFLFVTVRRVILKERLLFWLRLRNSLVLKTAERHRTVFSICRLFVVSVVAVWRLWLLSTVKPTDVQRHWMYRL